MILILLEPSGPVQPCNGIALPFYFTYHFPTNNRFPPYFKIPSLHFTSLHLPLCKPCSWKYSISSVIQNPFTSLHCTSLHFTALYFTALHFTYNFANPVLGNTRFPPYFKTPLLHFTSLHFTSLHFTSLHFTSLHLPLCKPCSWKYSISSVLQNPFTSFHCTSLHFTALHFIALHFTTLHFTYHFANSVLGNTRFPSLHFTSLNTTDGLS